MMANNLLDLQRNKKGEKILEINSVLKDSRLFQGISENEIDILLKCLKAETLNYQKGEFILHRGSPIHKMGLVITGIVHIVKEDFWGNRVIIGRAGPGQIFAESYACLSDEALTVSVIASKSTQVMFLDIGRILSVCTAACGFHTRLIQNLLTVLAKRNLMLTQKVEHMAQKTTREKLLSYLSSEAQRAGKSKFVIPYNRQELADYLSVDRSAMSTELSKLQREGILQCEKNKFQLFELPESF